MLRNLWSFRKNSRLSCSYTSDSTGRSPRCARVIHLLDTTHIYALVVELTLAHVLTRMKFSAVPYLRRLLSRRKDLTWIVRILHTYGHHIRHLAIHRSLVLEAASMVSMLLSGDSTNGSRNCVVVSLISLKLQSTSKDLRSRLHSTTKETQGELLTIIQNAYLNPSFCPLSLPPPCSLVWLGNGTLCSPDSLRRRSSTSENVSSVGGR